MTLEPTTPDSTENRDTSSIEPTTSTQETPSSTPPPASSESTPPPPPPLARAGLSIPRGAPLRPPKEEKEPEEKAEPAGKAPAPAPEEEAVEKEDEQDMEELFRAAVEGMEEGTGFVAGEIREVSVVALTGESVFVDVGDKAEGVLPIAEFLDADGKPHIEVGQTIPVEIRGHDSESGQVRVSHRSAIARLALARIEEAFEKKISLSGRVTEVVKGGLIVDIGLQAFMPASQTDLHRVEDLSQFVGQKVDVLVIEFNRTRKRAVVSRRQRLEDERKDAKRGLLEGLKPGETMEGTVKNIQEFGVFVDLGGVDGFIPREEISYDRGAAPDQFFKVGDVTQVKVLKVDPNSERITLSRKQTGTDPWADADSRFPVGARVRGKVVSLTHYGAFVQIEEGITGMIHASDMSWSTKANIKPSEFVNEGDIVEAQVLEINAEKRRLSLGLKQITMDPWIEVEAKYPVGSHVKGSVTSMTNYGAFVRLDEHIEGMVHVSDLSWEKRISHPNKVLKQGQEVECLVLKADPLQRRLSLGIKQLEESPFTSFQRSFPPGTIVTGEVTRVVPFGAFVKLPNDIEGLLHVSQIDEQRIEKPEQVLKVGEKVTCKVTKVDPRSGKISLSRKEALKQLDREFMKQYVNREVSGGMNLGEALRLAAMEQGKPEVIPTPAPKPKRAKKPKAEAPQAPKVEEESQAMAEDETQAKAEEIPPVNAEDEPQVKAEEMPASKAEETPETKAEEAFVVMVEEPVAVEIPPEPVVEPAKEAEASSTAEAAPETKEAEAPPPAEEKASETAPSPAADTNDETETKPDAEERAKDEASSAEAPAGEQGKVKLPPLPSIFTTPLTDEMPESDPEPKQE